MYYRTSVIILGIKKIAGMAGSGKSTFTLTISDYLKYNNISHYIINLDPGCIKLPYISNIDIRDTVNLRAIMKYHSMGPNASMIVAVNLFITKFDELMKVFFQFGNKRLEYLIVDTPGQMEIFLWSIAGFIISSLIKFAFRTLIVYVFDLKKCVNINTFLSNLLICSCILFRIKTKILLIFNKSATTDYCRINKIINNSENFHSLITLKRTLFYDVLENFFSIIAGNLHFLLLYKSIDCIRKININEFLSFLE